MPAAILLGAALGAALSLTENAQRKAEAKVLVSSRAGPAHVRALLPDLRELATSSVLAGNVHSTLRLPGSEEDVRRRLRASIPARTQVIVLSATDHDADRATQIAQEAAVVLTQLVAARFGKPQASLGATVLDPAHVVPGDVGRHPWRDASIGALTGLVVALVAMAPVRGGAAVSRRPGKNAIPRDLARREALLDRRIEIVTARERALALRAGELAATRRKLAPEPSEEERSPEPAREPPPVDLEAAQPPRSEPPLSASGPWSLNELERAAAARTDAPAEQREQWRTYLFFLRDHAAVDGSLPRSFDSLVEEMFRGLLERGSSDPPQGRSSEDWG